MKITKFVHSCLLVEMPAPINRTALFDPGMMSEQALDVDTLEFLDDIFITHYHGDHMSTALIKKLVEKFPEVRITAPQDAVDQMKAEGITASTEPPEGVTFFNSPHESTEPVFPLPQEIGIHYLDLLSDPGDSHSFTETKAILALPVTAPWGSNIDAIKLALELRPRYIVPIHDWHWSDQARSSGYEQMEKLFAESGITFLKMETGVPVTIDVEAKRVRSSTI
jgi:L-ascorbate metabolism protein UlaG (beta-lactamase superfamily)